MLALAAAALLASLACPQTQAPAPADAETLAAVKRFVRLDVADMTPAYIERMMAVDPETIPQPWRRRLQAKQLELNTFRQLGEGKRKGTVRIPDDECAIPKDAKSGSVRILQMAGYVEIYDDDMAYLEDSTHCTERKMMCEFSLQVVVEGDKKGRAHKRYFLHPKDPLMALVSEFRTRHGNHDTNFFGGKIFPTCSG